MSEARSSFGAGGGESEGADRGGPQLTQVAIADIHSATSSSLAGVQRGVAVIWLGHALAAVGIFIGKRRARQENGNIHGSIDPVRPYLAASRYFVELTFEPAEALLFTESSMQTRSVSGITFRFRST
eukprot:SAG11_NODE_10588_length_819_cov_0.715278_2_plen_126_part_01